MLFDAAFLGHSFIALQKLLVVIIYEATVLELPTLST